jgi:hypothetical protein
MEERSKLYGSTVSVSSAGWRVGRDLKCSLPEENYHYNNLLRSERPKCDYKLGTGISLGNCVSSPPRLTEIHNAGRYVSAPPLRTQHGSRILNINATLTWSLHRATNSKLSSTELALFCLLAISFMTLPYLILNNKTYCKMVYPSKHFVVPPR